LIQLRPAALVRASFKRYQQAPIGAPAEQLVALLDADGAGLARAALASIDEHQADDGTGEAATDERSARPVDRPAPTAPPPGTRPSPQAVPERAPASSSTWPWLAAALLLALMLVLASRSRSGSRRLH
jgi:hypothetical protein